MSDLTIDEQPLLDSLDQTSKTKPNNRNNASPLASRYCRLSVCRRHFFLFVILILLLLYLVVDQSRLSSINLSDKLSHRMSYLILLSNCSNLALQDNQTYLIDTQTCRLKDWPLFDEEIRVLYVNQSDQELVCDKKLPPFSINRVNFTWIQIDFPLDSNWTCHATELGRDEQNDGMKRGPVIGPLGGLTNLNNNLTQTQLLISGPPRWDSVEVNCDNNDNQTAKYSRVVPLVQHYTSTYETDKNKTNVILLGIDSISRLNFLRHLLKTKDFLDQNGFIPMNGYHKTGENSFPNIFSMFTGRLSSYYFNDSVGGKFRFDWIPLIFKDFEEKGYVTTFIEDMSPYGFFSTRGGFTVQPTDYYLRPSNIAIWPHLYTGQACYQDRIEHELYWDYLLDLFNAFRVRGNQLHFTFAHMSTLTHNHFNHAGLVDKPFHRFLERLFRAGHHQNSVIMVYSDHALRFGQVMSTKASIHESRLPFFYIYIPDSLTLSGMNSTQLRAIVRANQHRLTSHIDLHATMLHVLSGQPPNSEPFSRSLLTPIAVNRTCSSAGIPSQYCLCNSYEPINITTQVIQQTNSVVTHINRLMASHGNHCIPLSLDSIHRTFESFSISSKKSHRLVRFRTLPNKAIFEAILRIDDKDQIEQIENISRLSAYGTQSKCVADNLTIVQYCYCWQALLDDLKQKRING